MHPDLDSIYPHIIPEITEWPIYKMSDNRSDFIKRLNEYTKGRLINETKADIEEVLKKTIYLEKQRAKRTPWKVDPADDKTYWNALDKEIIDAISRDNKDALLNQILERIINRYNEEIVGNFKKKTFKFARKFLTSLFKRLFNAARGNGVLRPWGNRRSLQNSIIAHGHVDELRNLFNKGTVVILPTHFSNLDSILIGYTLDAVVGIPAPAYGAGLNLLNNEIVAYFINRLGAYRVDRRKKNPIYLECLKSMSSYSIQQGINQIFFPGGTRARDGKIESKVKLGLLGSVVEAQRHAIFDNTGNKIFIVPMVLNYNFVLEADALIEQYLRKNGKEQYTKSKSKSGPKSTFKFLKNLVTKKSDIEVSFGRPYDVFGNEVDTEGNSLDKNGEVIDIEGYFKSEGELKTVVQREKVYTKLLGEKITKSFSINNVVLPSHLVAYTAFRMLMHSNKNVPFYKLFNLKPDDFEIDKELFKKVIGKLKTHLIKLNKNGKILLSDKLEAPLETVIQQGIDYLGIYHVQKVLKVDKNDKIKSENLRLLFYYHNALDGYDLDEAINLVDYIEEPLLVNQNRED